MTVLTSTRNLLSYPVPERSSSFFPDHFYSFLSFQDESIFQEGGGYSLINCRFHFLQPTCAIIPNAFLLPQFLPAVTCFFNYTIIIIIIIMKHTHTHTHIYIYIYIYVTVADRVRESWHFARPMRSQQNGKNLHDALKIYNIFDCAHATYDVGICITTLLCTTKPWFL